MIAPPAAPAFSAGGELRDGTNAGRERRENRLAPPADLIVLAPWTMPMSQAVAPAAPADALAFYAECLELLERSGLPYLLVGTHAVNAYAGMDRPVRDLDVFCRGRRLPAHSQLSARGRRHRLCRCQGLRRRFRCPDAQPVWPTRDQAVRRRRSRGGDPSGTRAAGLGAEANVGSPISGDAVPGRQRQTFQGLTINCATTSHTLK
jgi:hypothetical protein